LENNKIENLDYLKCFSNSKIKILAISGNPIVSNNLNTIREYLFKMIPSLEIIDGFDRNGNKVEFMNEEEEEEEFEENEEEVENNNSNIESLVKIEIKSYNDLEPFPEDYDFILLIQKMKEILKKENFNKLFDWKDQFFAINDLRRLFKHEKEIFNLIFYRLKLYESILPILNSINSILQKNIILLLNEVFSEKNQNSTIINLLIKTIPKLIFKACSSQSFIKSEAKACLEIIVENMKYSETLITLLKEMNIPNIDDFELAYTLSEKLINNLGKDFFMDNINFIDIIGTLEHNLEISVKIDDEAKEILKRRYKTILKTLEGIMTKNDFDNMMEKYVKSEGDKFKEIYNLYLNNSIIY